MAFRGRLVRQAPPEGSPPALNRPMNRAEIPPPGTEALFEQLFGIRGGESGAHGDASF